MRIKIIQTILDKIRNKKGKYILISSNNSVSLPKNTDNLRININGVGNIVVFEDNYIDVLSDTLINISIYGDNNHIKIKKGLCVRQNMKILIGHNHKNFGKVHDSTFVIGKNVAVGSFTYTTYNSHTYCDIGDECMFSEHINLFNTDSHPIFDIDSKEIINKVKGIKIGKHCWIGRNSTILKNVNIEDDCIIGWGAIVTKGVNESHCAVAGNPAKIVKRNITWDSNGNKYGYISNSPKAIIAVESNKPNGIL